jgi:hypothetical protein
MAHADSDKDKPDFSETDWKEYQMALEEATGLTREQLQDRTEAAERREAAAKGHTDKQRLARSRLAAVSLTVRHEYSQSGQTARKV